MNNESKWTPEQQNFLAQVNQPLLMMVDVFERFNIKLEFTLTPVKVVESQVLQELKDVSE